MSIKINNNVVIGNDRSFITSSGTTAERPANPEVGMIRYNTTVLAWELYNGVEWENVTEPLPPAITALAWGQGSFGRLGTNDIINRSSPTSVVGGFADWTEISAGDAHSLALRNNGTIWAWGSGANGRLGTNDIINRSSPVQVVGGITDWTQLSAGGHSLALRNNGTIWAWGVGTNGQLGANDTIDRSSPTSVVGGITDWTQISAGRYHNLVQRSNGTLWAWGSGNQGRLGNGDIIDRSSPTSVVGGITDWTEISAGVYHNLVQRSNGTLWAWGSGANGRLGTNDIINRSSPVQVVGGITDWIKISAGSTHNLALRSNGSLWAWGNGGLGRLGVNDLADRSSPTSVVGGITDWTQISAGIVHSLAIRSNGTVWAWGYGGNGQLGVNDIINRSSPVSVVGGITDWIKISAGSTHNLALRIAEE
jgi:alpha-tubulin suppressor-like RCC1 family protein